MNELSRKGKFRKSELRIEIELREFDKKKLKK